MEPRGPEAKAFVESDIGQGLLSDASLWFRLISRDGEYLYVSPQVEKFLGYLPEDFVTIDPASVFHPDEIHISAPVMAALDVGPVNAIYRMRRQDGRYVWVSSHVQAMGDMVLILGRDVPPRMSGVTWKHVEPFL